jgi:hypothetical protein
MADSRTVVKALVEVDPGFVQLCETLFGKAVDAAEVWGWLYTPDGIAAAPAGKVSKAPDQADLHAMGTITKPAKGVLVPKPPAVPVAPVPPASAQVIAGKKPANPVATGVGKRDDEVDLVWSGEFAKADPRKRQAFGWASVVEVNGSPIVDLQGDLISPEDLETAAYAYVEKSRIGGDQHARDFDGGPLRAGHLIESVVYTDDKYEALAKAANLGPEVFEDAPRGWWVGFQYPSGSTWDDIESGRKTGFSVHGRGKRIPVDA